MTKRLALFLFVFSITALAQRDPVLKQIDHPHNYYFREMYLPQLTTGPSSVTWSPDSKQVIYSMKGSLWRQSLDSDLAEQLTDGPGYDYQPDWSPDGRYVVYSKYWNDAVELFILDLQSKQSSQLTKDAAVNVEPHWSPDGTKIAFVSTMYNKHFHIFTMGMKDGLPTSTQRITGETKFPHPRYYYGAVDHEISPTWSPDSQEIIFISNRGRIYGTGGLWRMKAEPESASRPEPKLILYEDTTWKARPHWSPDGKRVVYASYDRRQWHQLWLTTAEGGDPLALTFGDYDNTAPRWSPDTKKIAFISNRNGNTELWTVDTVGGHQQQIVATQLHYLKPMAKLIVSVLDPAGKPTDARISITAADGRAYAPDSVWMHADDSFVRAEMKEEPHYFHSTGKSEITVPAGTITILAMKGPEYELARREIKVTPGTPAHVEIRLKAFPALPGATRWVSSDLHVHMNYGGTYRNTPEHMLAQARAENLNIVNNLIVNKEQRTPDIAYFSGKPDRLSTAENVLMHGQEYHTSFWGHTGLLGLKRNLLIPEYAVYPNTAAASAYPSNTVIADLAHEQGALFGYVHPYEAEQMPDPSAASNHALPIDVALGKVDYIEILGFADHRSTAEIWYRLLNLGFRIPAGAGTDAMANFTSLRGPVGTNRTYVASAAGPVNNDAFLKGLKAGKTFATNAPLINFTLGGKQIGDVISAPKAEMPFTASLRSIVPVNHFELFCNGKVVKDLTSQIKNNIADISGTLPMDASHSGWCVLRAWNDQPQYPVLDLYPYATTSPIYIDVAGKPQRSPDDAKFFVAWIEHIQSRLRSNTDWNTPAEKEFVMQSLEKAKQVYEEKAK